MPDTDSYSQLDEEERIIPDSEYVAFPTKTPSDRNKSSRENKEEGAFAFICGLSGQCLSIKIFLDRSPDTHFYLLLKAVDAILRGISQVMFVSNPLSGLMILLGLFSLLEEGRWEVGVSVLICSALALLTAITYKQPRCLVQNGITQFNAVLVGSVVMSLYKGVIDARCWILVLFGASASVILQTSLTNALSCIQASFSTGFNQEKKSFGISPLTLPFNIVCCVIMEILAKMLPPDEIISEPSSVVNFSVEWERVVEGSVLSMGQVYGVETLIGSILIFFGVALFSPLLAVVELLGAFIGSFVAVGITHPPYDAVYSGVWGYCSLLTAGALGGFFVVLTPSSVPATVLGVVSTTAVQAFLTPVFQVAKIPVFTVPFVLTTWVFLLLTTENGTIVRTENVSIPEKHLIQWRQQSAGRKMNSVIV